MLNLAARSRARGIETHIVGILNLDEGSPRVSQFTLPARRLGFGSPLILVAVFVLVISGALAVALFNRSNPFERDTAKFRTPMVARAYKSLAHDSTEDEVSGSASATPRPVLSRVERTVSNRPRRYGFRRTPPRAVEADGAMSQAVDRAESDGATAGESLVYALPTSLGPKAETAGSQALAGHTPTVEQSTDVPVATSGQGGASPQHLSEIVRSTPEDAAQRRARLEGLDAIRMLRRQ